MVNSLLSPSILYLWNKRTLYIGEYNGFSHITQGAASLLVGIDGPIDVLHVSTGRMFSAKSFLIPAGESFAIHGKGRRIANCYLDSYNEDFKRLKKIMINNRGNIYVGNADEELFAALFCKMLESKLDYDEASDLMNRIVFTPELRSSLCEPTDPRIIEVIDFIKRDTSINHAGSYLAKRINVSETTMQRLFKRTTGITVRRFRLWHRIFVTATLVAVGHSITEAAVETGFSDASHFNHVFKEMIGMKPSSIMRLRDNMTICAEPQYVYRLGH